MLWVKGQSEVSSCSIQPDLDTRAELHAQETGLLVLQAEVKCLLGKEDIRVCHQKTRGKPQGPTAMSQDWGSSGTRLLTLPFSPHSSFLTSPTSIHCLKLEPVLLSEARGLWVT